MSGTEAILRRLRTAWYGPSWHGPVVREALAGITAEQAALRVLPGTHSVWELVNHITAWREAALRGVREGITAVAEEENFRGPAEGSAREWDRALEQFAASEDKLLKCVASLRDDDLTRQVQGMEGTYTISLVLEGVADHDLYHAGQISLLRRAGSAIALPAE